MAMELSKKILRYDVLGSFDFITTIISIDSISSGEIEKARAIATPVLQDDISLNEYQIFSDIFPLVSHETMHFVDATSTLWGLRHLDLMNDADEALRSGGEENYWHAKAFYDHMRSIKLPDYYTVVNSSHPAEMVWKYQVTVGRRYDHAGVVENGKPVVFCRFSTAGGEFLARSPLSVVSLLEVSAMSQELQVRFALISKIRGDEAVVESARQSKAAMLYLYDHRLTEYSVCAHLVANFQSCSDILSAYRLAGVLARACLNFPVDGYQRIASVETLVNAFNWDSRNEYTLRVVQALAEKNVGVLYYVLALALPEKSFVSEASIEEGVRQSFLRLGADYQQLQDWSSEEARLLSSRLARSEIETIRQVGVAGGLNFQAVEWHRSLVDFNNLHLPPLLFNDLIPSLVYGRTDNVLSAIDLDVCFNEMWKVERSVFSFGEACV